MFKITQGSKNFKFFNNTKAVPTTSIFYFRRNIGVAVCIISSLKYHVFRDTVYFDG